MDLVFNNAKQYNMPNSRLYKDADRLQKVMLTRCKELESIKVRKTCTADCKFVADYLPFLIQVFFFFFGVGDRGVGQVDCH